MLSSSSKPSPREQAADWAVRLDAATLSPDERAALQAWLSADPAHAAALKQAQRVWRDLDAVASAAPPAPALRRKAPARAGQRRHARHRRAWLAACASIVLLALVYGQYSRVSLWWRADARTAVGETRELALPGGSRVQLDAASAVAFADDAQWREVKVLAGTVAFDVGHADPRPFRVRAGAVVVNDVGTRFQLSQDEGATRVLVASGIVQVRSAQGVDVLHAGEQMSVGVDGQRSKVEPVDVDAATAWTRGRLVFVDRPLREVVAALNRYYDGRIVLLDDAVGQRRISGVFRTAQPLAALDTIQQNLGLRVMRLGPGLILLRG